MRRDEQIKQQDQGKEDARFTSASVKNAHASGDGAMEKSDEQLDDNIAEDENTATKTGRILLTDKV